MSLGFQVLRAAFERQKGGESLGYVYARKGTLYISFRRPDGRWIRESAGTDKRTLAKALLAKKEQEMLRAEIAGLPIQSDLRLEEFVEEYLMHAEANKKPSSLRRDKVGLKRLLPAFGRMKLREITPGAVQRYVDARRLMKRKDGKTARASTISNEMNTLSAIFREAVRRELVLSNPVSRVKRPKEDNTIVRYLTPDEEQRLFAELPERLMPIVTVALHSGMRRGELLNLEWSDVDLDQRLILVRNTKSNRKRYIPMNDTLLETLKAIRKGSEDIHVFVNPTTGDAYEDIKKSWGTALKRASIQNFRFHDLRHTFASRLVQDGAQIVAVKELLGHRDISTTQRYAHLAPSDLRHAVDLLTRRKTERV